MMAFMAKNYRFEPNHWLFGRKFTKSPIQASCGRLPFSLFTFLFATVSEPFIALCVPAKKSTAKTAVIASDNIWTILGSDDAVVRDRARELVLKYTPATGDDFGVEIIEGGADNTDQATRVIFRTLEAVQTMPFFGGGKVVWLKDTNVFADTVAGRSQDTQSAIEQLLKYLEPGMPQDVYLIISARDVDKRRSAFLTLKKIGQTEVYDSVDITKSGWEDLVLPKVKEMGRERELEFDDDAVRLFVMLAGEKTRQIENEMEKVDLYLGDERRRVTLEDVRSIVSETHAGVMWDLGNAVAARDLPRALRVLDQLMGHGENAVGILLATIIPKIRGMWQTSELFSSYGIQVDVDRRDAPTRLEQQLTALPEEVQASLPRKKDGTLNIWSIFFAAKELKKFQPHELRSALEYCMLTNKSLVTARLDPKTALTMLLLRILGKSRAKMVRK
jgi:DNA polymerase III subunit delta